MRRIQCGKMSSVRRPLLISCYAAESLLPSKKEQIPKATLPGVSPRLWLSMVILAQKASLENVSSPTTKLSPLIFHLIFGS